MNLDYCFSKSKLVSKLIDYDTYSDRNCYVIKIILTNCKIMVYSSKNSPSFLVQIYNKEDILIYKSMCKRHNRFRNRIIVSSPKINNEIRCIVAEFTYFRRFNIDGLYMYFDSVKKDKNENIDTITAMINKVSI